MPNNHLNQFRTMFVNLRMQINILIEDCLRRVDEAELRQSKELTAEPTVRVEDGEIVDLELKGKPEKRV